MQTIDQLIIKVSSQIVGTHKKDRVLFNKCVYILEIIHYFLGCCICLSTNVSYGEIREEITQIWISKLISQILLSKLNFNWKNYTKDKYLDKMIDIILFGLLLLLLQLYQEDFIQFIQQLLHVFLDFIYLINII